MTLQGARGATFGASNAFFNTQILAAQTGGKIVNEEVEFTKYDILSLASSAYTYTDGKITVTDGAKGDKVLISYSAKATGEHMVARADDSNELMNVTAEVLLRELCKEELNNRVPYIAKCA